MIIRREQTTFIGTVVTDGLDVAKIILRFFVRIFSDEGCGHHATFLSSSVTVLTLYEAQSGLVPRVVVPILICSL